VCSSDLKQSKTKKISFPSLPISFFSSPSPFALSQLSIYNSFLLQLSLRSPLSPSLPLSLFLTLDLNIDLAHFLSIPFSFFFQTETRRRQTVRGRTRERAKERRKKCQTLKTAEWSSQTRTSWRKRSWKTETLDLPTWCRKRTRRSHTRWTIR